MKPQSSDAADTIEKAEDSKPSNMLEIVEETGDIFDAPPNTLLIHSCNCQGSWGGGIAKAFYDRYPKAYMEYVYECEENDPEALWGTAQLIPPVDAQQANKQDAKDEGFEEDDDINRQPDANDGDDIPKHFIGCLYTSRHYGRKRDKPDHILQATPLAMDDLLKQVNDWNAKNPSADEKVKEVRMCKINSGLFAVKWEKTKKVLESIDVSHFDVKTIKVVDRE